jgi:hypothetical protein
MIGSFRDRADQTFICQGIVPQNLQLLVTFSSLANGWVLFPRAYVNSLVIILVHLDN